jgi:hypothetical protein
MRTLLFALAAVAPLAMVTPSAAQDVGVRVGPFEAGVGPGYHEGWRHHHYYGDCRMTRERVITPSGREIFRTHRVCD